MTKSLSIKEIANRLVHLCREGDFGTTYRELFSPTNIKSIEPEGVPNQVIQGSIELITQKGQQFFANVESLNTSEISDPIIAGGHFSVIWKVNVTFKGDIQSHQLDEIIVYEVKEGKIISEQFFFNPKTTHPLFQNAPVK